MMKDTLETETTEATTPPGSPSAKATFMQRMIQLFGASSRASSVFGEPVERDGLTIVPVAKMRMGFGGSGGGDADGSHSEGGAGGGLRVTPIGYIELRGNETRYLSIRDPSSYVPLVVAGGVAGLLVLRGLRRLLR